MDEYWQRPPAEGPYDASTGRGWRAQRTRWFRWVFAAALFVILGKLWLMQKVLRMVNRKSYSLKSSFLKMY